MSSDLSVLSRFVKWGPQCARCWQLSAMLLLLAGCESVTATPAAHPAEPLASTSGPPPQPVTNGNLVTRNVPDIPAATLARVRQYGNSRSASLLGFVGDEMLISTRFAQTNQIHRVASPLGARTQLTFFNEPVSSVAVPPVAQPTGYLYGRDVGGSEFYQLFWYDFATGASRMLSDGKSRYSNVRFSNDGVRFAYTTTERDGKHHDIHTSDLEGNQAIVYESADGLWAPLDFSPDNERLLVLKYVSINESELHEINLASGAKRQLLADRSPFAVGSATYDASGNSVLFSADLGTEFVGLQQLDLGSGRLTALTSGDTWDLEALAQSDDGQYLAYVANQDGLSQLTVRSLVKGTTLPLPKLPVGVIRNLQFHRNNELLGFTLYTPTTPGDVYTLNVRSGQLERWTESETGGLNSSRLVTPELIRYPTFDRHAGQRRQIPAFYFRPDRPGPLPVVIFIHGGPESQYRPFLSSIIQLLATELGIAVIAPNVRGSTGYGKSYMQLDNGYLREDSVKDIGALLDWIEQQEQLDADRVAVMGGSYGGYMVLAALVTYAERLAAGVEIVGISNFVTFLENTQPYRRDLRRVEYGDERDPDMRAFLQNISPLSQVSKLSDPLLISQGANDPRVPASESEQIVAALSDKNVPVWYVLAKDEGHGFRKQRNREYNNAATALFLERYLVAEPAEAAP